jgi:hypothetical protein
LTRNDPEQEERLQNLATAVKAVFADDSQIIGIYARQGSNAAVQADKADQQATTVAINDLAKFTDKEEELLSKRDAIDQKDYHLATRLLICASILVAGLLIVANAVAGREMGRRRKAENEQRETIAKLQKALAEVKTLSGLVPICGWCKKVRKRYRLLAKCRTIRWFAHGRYLLTRHVPRMWREIQGRYFQDRLAERDLGTLAASSQIVVPQWTLAVLFILK